MRKYLMFFALTSILCGCSYLNYTRSPKASEIKDVIRLKVPRPDFINVVDEIGKEDGYEVRKSAYRSGILDTSMGQPLSISLVSGAGIGENALKHIVGAPTRVVMLVFDSDDNGKTWFCNINVQGDLSSGREDAALNFWSEFKPKLLRRLTQNFNLSADNLFENISSVRKNNIRPEVNQPEKRRDIFEDF